MRNRFQRAKACLAVAAAFSAPCSAHAAGLGQLTVLSTLGQPLRAEIALLSTQPGDVDHLQAGLASPEVFQRAGVDYAPVLKSLRFRVDQRPDGHYLIEVRSSGPINEPYVDMLVQLDSVSGPLTRRFVFLLDPLEYAARSGASHSAKLAVAEATDPRVTVTPARTPIARNGAAARAAARVPGTQQPATYRVEPGDTLARIAALKRPQGISVVRMQDAIYALNQNAFVNSNRNLLRVGQALVMPSFGPSPETAPAPVQPGATQIPAASMASSARFADDPELQQARKDLAVFEEKVARMRDALRELDERIDRFQRSLPAAPVAQDASQQPEAAIWKPLDTPDGRVIVGAARPQPAPVTRAAEQVRTPVSFLDSLPGPSQLSLGGAALAMLAALGVWWHRRNGSKTSAYPGDTQIMMGDDADSPAFEETHTIFAPEELNTEEFDLRQTDFSQAGIGEIDTDIDPIAEADVYLGYGRVAQAEEILKEALNAPTPRDAVRVKLLEIYAERKDLHAFNLLATSLHAATGGRGSDWARAAAFGREVDPDNPMYQAPVDVPVDEEAAPYTPAQKKRALEQAKTIPIDVLTPALELALGPRATATEETEAPAEGEVALAEETAAPAETMTPPLELELHMTPEENEAAPPEMTATPLELKLHATPPETEAAPAQTETALEPASLPG